MSRFLLVLLLGCFCAEAAEADFLYCLQPRGARVDFPERAARTGRSHIVIDEAFDGSEGTRWTGEEMRRFRARGATVLCYFSIGEAEEYRSYWQKAWKKKLPGFIVEENPEWKGNYRVRYWRPQWQEIILKALERIVAAGFDGVYLDIVDGFEFFEDFGKKEFCRNPETGRTFRADMVQWILRIAETARRKNPKFQIFMQNGEALLADAKLQRAVDGISLEDLFTDGAKLRKKAEILYRLRSVKTFLAAGKPCFAIEYCPEKRKKELLSRMKEYRIPVLLTDRELTGFGEFLPVQ